MITLAVDKDGACSTHCDFITDPKNKLCLKGWNYSSGYHKDWAIVPAKECPVAHLKNRIKKFDLVERKEG